MFHDWLLKFKIKLLVSLSSYSYFIFILFFILFFIYFLFIIFIIYFFANENDYFFAIMFVIHSSRFLILNNSIYYLFPARPLSKSSMQ